MEKVFNSISLVSLNKALPYSASYSVAIVTVESQPSAEAAVKELNGLKIKGYALQVAHISSAEVEDQGQLSLVEPESSISANKNQNQVRFL